MVSAKFRQSQRTGRTLGGKKTAAPVALRRLIDHPHLQDPQRTSRDSLHLLEKEEDNLRRAAASVAGTDGAKPAVHLEELREAPLTPTVDCAGRGCFRRHHGAPGQLDLSIGRRTGARE